MKRLFSILLFSALPFWGLSQNYPIYVSTTLTPPYPLRLSDYSRAGAQALVATVMVRDLSVSNLPVKLRIKLETAGVTIETPVTITAPPIYLSGGQVLPLFGDDLAPYFNPDNLIFKGYSKETYRRTGQLPEGLYHFTVEVLHYSTGRLISNAGRATAWIALGKPPLLKDPAEAATLGQVAGMPLLFSWTAAKVGVPQGNIFYTFDLWELRIAGVDPHIVAATLPPFYTAAPQPATTLPLHPVALMLEPGLRYAWRITAADPSGVVPFEQNGQSELRTFTYLAKCDSVTQLKVAMGANHSATLSWQPGPRHQHFTVEVENPATGWSSSSTSFDCRVPYHNLAPGSRYRLRVQAACSDPLQTTSNFSAWVPLAVPPPKPPDSAPPCPGCRCDNAGPLPQITNIELRKDLKPGDTLIDKRGTTRYILKTVEQQRDGVYRGIFLFWAEIWQLKFLCVYENLSVNTDNIILRMNFESVYNPQLLLDADKAKDHLDSLAGAVNELTTSNTIRDTLRYRGPIESMYSRNDSVWVLTRNPNGSLTETLLSDDIPGGTLVQGANGEEFVVAANGTVLGVDEFQSTGGSARQIWEYNSEKEGRQTAAVPSITFTAAAGQAYGFDTYTEPKEALKVEYPELYRSYRPAYKSLKSWATDRVTSSGGANISYRTDLGLPALASGSELTLRGSSAGSQTALYAYAKKDSTEEIAGKLHLVNYDEQTKKVYLVPVNNATLPDEAALRRTLNSIYAPTITSWEVAKLPSVTVPFPGGHMTHGGSSALAVYNADQKAVLSTAGDMEKNALYLFFVSNVQGKDGDIAGYMPLQHQAGFIYESPAPYIIAHELGHGAFNLRHTFSPDRFIAAQGKTQNLMDYAGGTELWKHQWDEIQDPQNIWLDFLMEEDEGQGRKALDVLETIVRLRFYRNSKTDIQLNEAQGVERASSRFFDKKLQKQVSIVCKKSLLSHDSPISLSEKHLSAFGTQGYLIDVGDNFQIICQSEEDRSLLYDFITATSNIAAFGKETLTVAETTYSLEKVFLTLEKIKIDLVAQNIYHNLSHEERLILDLPTIEWGIGWKYTSVLLYSWIIGSGNIIMDDNMQKWLFSWNLIGDRMSTFEALLAENINTTISSTIAGKHNFRLYQLKDVSAVAWPAHSTIASTAKNLSHFGSISITALENRENLNDYVGSFGSITLQYRYAGKLTSADVITITETSIAVEDKFDFVDEGAISQPLGVWFYSICDPESPVDWSGILDYNWFRLENSTFNSFREKTKLGVDFSIQTKKPAKVHPPLLDSIVIKGNGVVYKKE